MPSLVFHETLGTDLHPIGGQLFDVERTRGFNLVEVGDCSWSMSVGPTWGCVICMGLVGCQMSSLKTRDTGVNVIALSKSNSALTLPNSCSGETGKVEVPDVSVGSFLHDDIVAAVSNPCGLTCIVVEVHLTIDLKSLGGEIKTYISSKKLKRIMAFAEGDYVLHEPWLGNLLEDTQYPYHPGQHVQDSSSLVFKNARWLRGAWRQEMDHLKMTVAKIEVHHPNVLLVEKTVSRYAQELFLPLAILLHQKWDTVSYSMWTNCGGAWQCWSAGRQEGLEIDKNALNLIVSESDGSLQDAEMTLDQLNTVNMVECLRELMEASVDPISLVLQLASLITYILAGSYKLPEERLRRTTTWLTTALLQLAPDQSYMLPSSFAGANGKEEEAFKEELRTPKRQREK
eukprot:Gb_22217 [translate_table: standard]